MAEGKIQKKRGRMVSYRGIITIFIVICLMVSAFSYLYYKNLHTTIRNESKGYLQEVSARIGSNLNRIIDDSFSALYTMGDSLEASGESSLLALRPLLKEQQNHWEYENILLVDRSGRAFDVNDSGSTFLTFGDDMRTDILNKVETMSTQMINNKEYVLFAVPLKGVEVDGNEVVSLAAVYDMDLFNQVLSMTSFDDQAYSQIITKSGTTVTSVSSEYAIKSGYNVFSTLKAAKLDDGIPLDQVQEEIKNDKVNQISFTLDDARWYMVYTPIQPDEWCLLTFVPSQTVNAKSDMLLQSTLLICGLIVITFCVLIAVLFYVFSANRRKLERIAYVDGVTGGNTIERFYELARETLDTESGTQYAMLYTNIENFKVLNSQMGRQSCDEILEHFYLYTASVLSGEECMGRMSADNFCILLSYENEEAMFKRLEKWGTGAEQYVNNLQLAWSMPMTEFGIYVIENKDLSFPEIIDRAKLSLKNPQQVITNKLRFAFYDDEARRRLFREKQISDMMGDALENHEFQLYLQPKVHLPEEKIGGAEALVRWVSKSEGMIYPNDFIPLFEKNGFIVQVDLWIFEEVCRTMRSWLDRGLEPFKVSVNCSRVHFKDPHFLQPYLKAAEQYGIDKKYLEIELTESVVFEDTKHLMKIIQEIRMAGFGCSMDDFGSGYSSLNLIQSIPVDTLKIDKIFFDRVAGEQNRTEAVVGSIVQMAKSLSLTTVAEGVEYREQVELLKRVGCDYIQGYVFAKPMPVADFDALAFGSKEV